MLIRLTISIDSATLAACKFLRLQVEPINISLTTCLAKSLRVPTHERLSHLPLLQRG